MNKSSTRPYAAGLAALLTLAMLCSVQALFGAGPTPAANAVYGSGDPDAQTQVVVIVGQRMART